MTRDTVSENISNYLGDRARQQWTLDQGLYEAEELLIARHFPPPPARVLDLGCGAGRTTVVLESRGYDVRAIDLSEDLVDEARKRVKRATVSVMDARELAFEDATFDAALFSFNGLDCVHPASERQRVLEEVHRVLRPGGVFYYSGHNGIAAWFPRHGESLRRTLRRDREMLRAQRRPIADRTRYLAYPGSGGTQVLYSALPAQHDRDLHRAGFVPVAVYGSRNYRKGPHFLDGGPLVAAGLSDAARLARLALSCPHLHYVAVKPSAP